MESLSQAASGQRALGTDPYRFFDRSDLTAETPEAILAPHRDRTLLRMRSEPVVLCFQDGTDLSLDSPPEFEWPGDFDTGATTEGLHLHSTLAVTPGGLPLGVVDARFDALPGPDEPSTAQTRKTERWLEGYRCCAALGRDLGPGRVVCVMDRPAGDVFEIFAARRTEPDADLLVHARGNRRVAAVDASGGTGPVQSLPRTLQAAPALGTITVAIDRLTARSRRTAPGAALAVRSQAALVVRSQTVELAPTGGTHRGRPPIRLQAVMVEEERTPGGATPLRWLLLTTLAADNLDACKTVVGYYAWRWRMEDWQRILKSGCKEQELGQYPDDEVARAVAVNLVIAWRLQLMTLLDRDQPEGTPEILFSDLEIMVLRGYTVQLRYPPPDTLAAAVLNLARLGGHVHRTGGPSPGIRVMWRGYATLVNWCVGAQFRLDEET